ncbi:MAG: fumarylacetoacetate hydrolase family protein [Cyclobacteriaceae bacterium]|nr:fumarylacetoacetate hydrolase family protein [Cyclobacteriaceae bacterium]
MKLIRYGEPGEELPGVMDEHNRRLSVKDFGEDFDERFFDTSGPERLKIWVLKNIDSLQEVPESVRWASPVCRPSKLICIGLNYRDHAKESGLDLPKEPVVFFKSTTALCGPFDNLVIPKNSEKTDWEVELAIVIGKKASYIEEAEAEDYIAGYALHNDYSEREYQIERGGQWVKGKSCDTFAPFGPFVATKEEIEDVGNLSMWLEVNGKTMQKGTTREMIFSVPFVVSYLSQFMTLLPGDIISTGTPAGVGLGMKPPVYIKEGDVIRLGIEGLGESSQKAIKYPG